jgi:hypothetical protein
MATVVERAISGQLEPVNGRRHDLLPWEQHRLDWAAEVGDVFQPRLLTAICWWRASQKRAVKFSTLTLTAKFTRHREARAPHNELAAIATLAR